MSDMKASLQVKCLFCGDKGNLLHEDGKVFSASTVKVKDKVRCLCMNCLKRIYQINLPYLKEEMSEATTSHTEATGQITQEKRPPSRPPERNSGESLKDKSLAPEKSKSVQDELNEAIAENLKVVNSYLDSYVNILKGHVFGQPEAIKRTAFVMYRNQFCNLIENLGIIPPRRQSAMLIGSTGVGKTFIARTTAQAMQISIAKSNADAITSAGYIGDKVEAILERAYFAAGKNLKKAEESIIIIDEIDKKAKSISSSGRDINGLAVQQELLKLLEPNVIDILHGTVSFDTSRLTVIFCGAFNGLKDIIKKRMQPSAMGFSSDVEIPSDKLLTQVTPNDLVKYGLIEEFVGRIPNPTVLEDLSTEAILDIIYEKLSQEDVLFQVKGFDLRVDPFVLQKIASRVIEHNTGARDVDKELSELLFNAEYTLFNSPSNGMCDIDEYGNTTVMYSDRATKEVKIDTFPGPAYLQYECD